MVPGSPVSIRLATRVSHASAHAPLIAALAAPEVDAALEDALAQLGTSDDEALLLAAVEALVRTGAPGLAARLIRSKPGLLAASAELQSRLQEISRLPTGERPFAELARDFHINARHLLDRHPHLRGVIDPSAAPAGDIHLFVTRQGNPQVIRDAPHGGLEFVFPFGDHRRLADRVDLGRIAAGASFLLLGVPGVRLLDRLVSLRAPHRYRPPIDIIEPDLSVLAIWLHLPGLGAICRDQCVTLFAGAEAFKQYASFRLEHLHRAEPTHILTNRRPGWTPPRLDELLRRRVRLSVSARRAELLERQRRFYDRRTCGRWAERFRGAGRGQPPLRILGVTSRFSTYIQHAMRDLAAAFRRRGCDVELVKEPSDCAADIDLWSLLARRPYDLLLVINHLRFEFPDRVHPHLPYVCWIQDHMQRLLTRKAGESVGPFDLVLGQGGGDLTSLYRYPSRRLLPTTAVTDPHTYRSDPVPACDRERYACDVSYVSHGSLAPEQMVAQLAGEQGPAFSAYLQRVLQWMRHRLAERGWVSFTDRLAVIVEAQDRCPGISFTPEQRRAVVVPIVTTLFDRLIRHQALAWAARWAEARGRSFKLFGRGWEDHPTLARYACGEIENGYALRCLYQATKVNLQISGYATLHQRLLDGLCSGGFFLTRFQPADFLGRSKRLLQSVIGRDRIASLEHLLRCAHESAEVRSLIDQLHRLGHPRIAPSTDPQRRREARCFREVLAYPPGATDDPALFRSLCCDEHLPYHAAVDLPRFEFTVFRSRRELHDLLDRYVDDEGARRAVAAPMRHWVMRHATYDNLAARILTTFQSLFEAEAMRYDAESTP